VAQGASRRSEQAASIDDGRHAYVAIGAYRRRLIQKLHEPHEGHDIGDVRAAHVEPGVVLRRGIRRALRVFLALTLEVFIGNAHLHGIGLTRENQERLVLRLPAETRDSAIVAVGVDMTFDAVISFHSARIARQVVPDGCVSDRFDQPCAESGRGNPEDHVVVGLLPGEVRLLNGTAGGLIRPAGNGEKIMHATVRAAVRVPDEACFADWSTRGDERRHSISRRHSRSTSELRIYRRATSSQGRLNVATAARIQIETRAEPINDGLHLRELRYPVIIEKVEV